MSKIKPQGGQGVSFLVSGGGYLEGACLESFRDRETNREYVRRRTTEYKIREVREETDYVESCTTSGGLWLILEDRESLKCFMHRCGMI